jgi:hypothetical protein
VIVKPVVFHPEAQAEFLAAQDYYEQCVAGLGFDYRAEVQGALDVVAAAPQRLAVYSHGTQAYFVHRFPFAVIYLDLPDKVWVVAIAHLRRRPGYWKDRL